MDDIALFGEDFNVLAIYGDTPQTNKFIIDFVDADRPVLEDLTPGPYNAQDVEEFRLMLEEYETGLALALANKYEKMTLQQLLTKLEDQSRLL